jgi:aromatic-L-amino-acid decarboxylase
MTPEEFRVSGHRLIDWIADYRISIKNLPVKSKVKPGETAAHFELSPPLQTCSFDTLLSELENVIVPGITQVQHPMHFGWFPSNAALSSVLGDIASSGLGTLGISWESCPALTEVEQVVCDWMRQLTGLSELWKGTIHDTASTACLTAMLIARERATDQSQNREGLQSVSNFLTVYTTDEAHSSVKKAALLAGFGNQNIRIIDIDPDTRGMSATVLKKQIQEDSANNYQPTIVVATAGSTGTTAFDPIADISQIVNEHQIWLHVDAAMAGSAMLLPECRHLWNGVENADSISWNPHKWMGTILDCALFYVKDPQHLIRVMSTNPSYLRSSVDDKTTQYRDWGIPLGRRFRALKLLFQLRLDGVEEIKKRIRRDIDNAHWFEQQVQQAPYWTVVTPVTLQTICIRHQPNALDEESINQHNRQWLKDINQSGKTFLSPAKIDDIWIVRVSIGVEATERMHVEQLWDMIQEYAAANLVSSQN